VLLIAGGAVALMALAGLHGVAHSSLAAHMTQHVLLLNVAAPLLALGTTVPAVIDRVRPIVALALGVTVQSAVMLAWHAPGPYQAAIRTDALHAVEHLAFLGAAMVFWWTVVAACRRSFYAAAVLAVFFMPVPGALLGFGMTFSQTPWYPVAAALRSTTADAVRDQQLAGVVMWSFGGLASIAAGVTLFALWGLRGFLVDGERRSATSGGLLRRVGAGEVTAELGGEQRG
jgi:putative membrane protein